MIEKLLMALIGRINGTTEVPVVKSNTVDIPGMSGWIVLRATAGVVTVIPEGNGDSQTVTWTLAVNEITPVKVRRVMVTGTDAIVVNVIK